MNIVKSSLKSNAQIGLLFLFLLLIGAVLFFKERIFFGDCTFLAFNQINNKDFSFFHQRYGAFITLIIPFICQKLHIQLNIILFLYEISFNLLFILVALVLVYKYKQYMLAILMSLYYFLIVSDSYFLANAEIHQGIAWMFLLFAATIHLGTKKINIFLIIIPFSFLAFLTISSHFIAIIPTLFLWFYYIIEKKNWHFSLKDTLILTITLFFVIVLKYVLSKSEPYENNNMYNVIHVSIKDIINSFNAPEVKIFLYRCIVNYWIVVILFISCIYFYIKNKEFKMLSYYIFSIVCYIILMGLAYSESDGNFKLCHIELEWQCIGILIAAPFVFGILPKIKVQYSILFLLIIFITRSIYIYTSSQKFTWRTHYKEKIMAKMKEKNISKLALYFDDENRTKSILDWAIPYETLMESAINGDKPQITFFLVDKNDLETLNKIKNPKGFYNCWVIAPNNAFNPYYFSLDTTLPYTVLSYSELFK